MVERALKPGIHGNPSGEREPPSGWRYSLSSRLTLSPCRHPQRARSANDEMLRWPFRTHEAKGADPKTEPQREGAENVNGETCVRLPPCSFWPRLSLGPVLRLGRVWFLVPLVCGSGSRILCCFVLRPGFRRRVQSRTGAVPRTEHCWQVYPGMTTLWQVWYWVFLT